MWRECSPDGDDLVVSTVLRRIAYPLRLAWLRLTRRGERVLLVGLGIACGAALLAAAATVVVLLSLRAGGARIGGITVTPVDTAAVGALVAVASRPELLLADEPTSRLDQAKALAVGALLVDLARTSGAAVVCATHDPLLIEQADEVLRLG